MISREEQRAEDERMARERYEKRNDGGGFFGKNLLDFDVIGGYQKGLFYKPKEGINRIDIIPYLITTDNHPQKMKKGYTDHLLDVFVHRYVAKTSTFLCLEKMFGLACPLCEEREELRQDPDVTDEQIRSLKPVQRCYYNVIDLDSVDSSMRIQLFEEAHYLFQREILHKMGYKGDEIITHWEPENGKTIEFTVSKKKTPRGTSNEYRIEAFVNREPYPIDIIKEAFPLDAMMIIPSYEEVRNVYLGIEDKPSETKESGSNSSRRRIRTEPTHEEQPAENSRSSRTRTRNRREREDAEQHKISKEEPNKCPFGHRFGYDCDEFIENGHCDSCDEAIWNECAALNDQLNQEDKLER